MAPKRRGGAEARSALREIKPIHLELLVWGGGENEPVVCKPQEALDCFLRTDMDVLVMDNVMMSRSRAT